MTVLTISRDGSITAGKSILSSIANAFSVKNRSAKAEPEIKTLPNARNRKVVRIRKQLDSNTYNLDERLDAVLERILMDVNT